MNEAEFWHIIEVTHYQSAGDGEKQAEILVQYLLEFGEGEILDFGYIFRELHGKADDTRLWEAAGILEGGCGCDGFTDFRAGLIGRGQAIYEAALRDPETLVDVVETGEYISVEALNYVADKAYELKTGIDLMEIPYPCIPVPDVTSFHHESKSEWSEPEDLSRKYPKLYQKFTDYWDNHEF